jgi:hypothetical protein
MLLVISVLAGMVAVVATFAGTQAASFRAAQTEMDRERAELMARAGVERALAELSQPPLDAGSITLQDAWLQLGQLGADRFRVGFGWFRLQIVDAASLVNLSTAPEEQLLRLPLTTEQIDSLLDWRSEEDMGRPEGAKDPYYNSLTEPYNASLRPLETLDELFLIKGFSPAALYEPPPDTVSTQYFIAGASDIQPVLAELVTVRSTSPIVGPGGQQMRNIASATVPQLLQLGLSQQAALQVFGRRATYQSMGDVLRTPGIDLNAGGLLLDAYFVGTAALAEGKVNLNTASEPVLNSVPGFTPDITSAILSRQGFGMASLGELSTVPGVTLEILQQCVDYVTTTSQTFLIRVLGGYGQVTVALEALVLVENDAPRVLQITRPLVDEPLALWRWDPAPTSEIDLGVSP